MDNEKNIEPVDFNEIMKIYNTSIDKQLKWNKIRFILVSMVNILLMILIIVIYSRL